MYFGGERMPTKQEAAYYHRHYSNLYYEARGKRNRANEIMNERTKKKKQSESQLSSCKTQKKNFEERLRGVKKIISFLENNVSQCFDKANKSAISAGEKYVSAIRCDTISSANIGSSFHSKTIEEDTIMLKPAHQSCKDEKARLEREIQKLDEQIKTLNNAIASLESDIRRFRNAASNAEDDMRSYASRANHYAHYM